MRIYFLFALILFFSCKKEQENEDPSPINLSGDFALCNSQLSACINGNGNYCLFGFKWGADGSFSQSGYDAQGPASSGGVVTYSFQEENGLINTHRQIDLPSNSFNDILSCAKTEIRNALGSWAKIAAIEFEELPENSIADIRFYTADIIQGGIGYPNYPDNLCGNLSGNVIIQSDLGINDCNSFYIFALHEIGHVLGLGHVGTENVMNPDFSNFNFQDLQTGDTMGIIEIYGEK
ncbi:MULTISPECIES: matrixin family metalloprotease [Croceitalea]|uniref:Matrixin family metalloprotease n=1 Tax=Croceitalea vernalis TaxID=3075599 RepID=A0ABU3BEY8_9FLAO|nr:MULTISPECIES: matrixin family metalloprotease [unclassified Croceitalea]MDT0538942.1 matrixin family metalloprotease [Croceitalea sp. P059]MDT0620728.1 matrixin family metalloprotease [Croceitalea sp. P007]